MVLEEIGYICLTGVIGTVCGILGTAFMAKRFTSDENIMNKLEMILTNVTQDEKLQRSIYSVGILLGNGIATGTGLKGGGKMKFTDLIFQGIGQFLQGKMGSGQNQQEMNPLEEPNAIIKRKQW